MRAYQSHHKALGRLMDVPAVARVALSAFAMLCIGVLSALAREATEGGKRFGRHAGLIHSAILAQTTLQYRPVRPVNPMR